MLYVGMLVEFVVCVVFEICCYVFDDLVVVLCMLCELFGWLCLEVIVCNNISGLDVVFLLGVMIVVIGVFGVGKFSLVS